mmetsp:Transcript_3418/g.10373  ORF Transcript_3418/g.10373 Transcript_3418/m.10373 type:complete len:281 (-) Transcript_3418:379-1221(-)
MASSDSRRWRSALSSNRTVNLASSVWKTRSSSRSSTANVAAATMPLRASSEGCGECSAASTSASSMLAYDAPARSAATWRRTTLSSRSRCVWSGTMAAATAEWACICWAPRGSASPMWRTVISSSLQRSVSWRTWARRLWTSCSERLSNISRSTFARSASPNHCRRESTSARRASMESSCPVTFAFNMCISFVCVSATPTTTANLCSRPETMRRSSSFEAFVRSSTSAVMTAASCSSRCCAETASERPGGRYDSSYSSACQVRPRCVPRAGGSARCGEKS